MNDKFSGSPATAGMLAIYIINISMIVQVYLAMCLAAVMMADYARIQKTRINGIP